MPKNIQYTAMKNISISILLPHAFTIYFKNGESSQDFKNFTDYLGTTQKSAHPDLGNYTFVANHSNDHWDLHANDDDHDNGVYFGRSLTHSHMKFENEIDFNFFNRLLAKLMDCKLITPEEAHNFQYFFQIEMSKAMQSTFAGYNFFQPETLAVAEIGIEQITTTAEANLILDQDVEWELPTL